MISSAGLHESIFREPKDAFSDDVALHHRCTAANSERLGVEESPGPRAPVGAADSAGTATRQHARSTRESLGECHHLLSVVVSEGFAKRRVRTRRTTGYGVRGETEAKESQDLAVRPRSHQVVTLQCS